MCVQTMQPWPFKNNAPIPLNLRLLEKIRTPTPATSASIVLSNLHGMAVSSLCRTPWRPSWLRRGNRRTLEVLEHMYGRSGRHGKQPEHHGEPPRVSNKFNSSHTPWAISGSRLLIKLLLPNYSYKCRFQRFSRIQPTSILQQDSK